MPGLGPTRSWRERRKFERRKLATNSPQSETEQRREMKKTAGLEDSYFVANQGLNGYFVSIALS
jgi:hypothetical protein